MRSGVVYRDGALIVDHQPPGLGKNRVSQIVLRTDSGWPPQSGRPPVVRSARRTVADLRFRTCPAGYFRSVKMGRRDVAAECTQLNLELRVEHVADHRH